MANYNSDWMSRHMDDELEQIEARLSALYANADYEVNREFKKFTDTFKEKDFDMALKMQSGEITQEEYIRWRNVQILQTDMYKSTVDHITEVMVKTDLQAMVVVRGELPTVVAESYNFVQSLGWKAADEMGLSMGTFQVYNAKTVEVLIRDNPQLLPYVNVPIDKQWNKDRINREISQGVVQGESIPKIAERLQKVTAMDENSAIRNARTCMTGAENMGRAQSADDLKEKGMPIDEEWSATHDHRTRDTHLLLDGTLRDEDGYFGVGILDTPLRYPADPLGDPSEVYNCRCRLNIRLKGINHSQDGDLYKEFMEKNHPEDYQELKGSELQKEKDDIRRRTLDYQDVLKEINRKGYY